MSVSLVYVFTGNNQGLYSILPNYLIENLYQTYLFHYSNPISIYIITEKFYHPQLEAEIKDLDTDSEFTDHLTLVAIEDLPPMELDFGSNLQKFHGHFFQSAFKRFIYLHQFMVQSDATRIFHIEYDVMLYTHLNSVYQGLVSKGMTDKLVVVQDSPQRALASIMFIPNSATLRGFIEFTHDVLPRTCVGINEMAILGVYTNKYSFPNTLEDSNLFSMGYFDGACMGQYLGGIDPRNIQPSPENPYLNPSVGFVNETSDLKPNTVRVVERTKMMSLDMTPLKSYFMRIENKTVPIQCLHIHSKVLSLFSSQFQFRFADMISGDRIWERCDFIGCTMDNYIFHKNIGDISGRMILFQDTMDYASLNARMRQFTRPVRIGLYTHTMDAFFKKILPNLDEEVRFHIYLHNSDQSLARIPDCGGARVERIYTQNLNISGEILYPLPIGIANSMWEHGNMTSLFRVMTKTYYRMKKRSIYINMNRFTYWYRQKAIRLMETYRFPIRENKPFEEYLEELATYRFSLCVRGNGIDTHRFWESLYLGVIPVVVNNRHTQCSVFVERLRTLKIPFYEIKHLTDFCKTHDNTFFSVRLYADLMAEYPDYADRLKVDYYFSDSV